ncbi:MAG: hypothetical protein AAB885_03985, partial [Patescibacteria group bacterium]
MSFYGLFFQFKKFFILTLVLGLIFPPNLAFFNFNLIQKTFAASGTPQIISYQGRLANSSGTLLGSSSGTTFYFKFSIWDASSSGNQLWPSSVPNSVSATVTSGVFNVNIGDVDSGFPHALDYNFNTTETIYLQVEVSSNNSSFETLTHRQLISSAAFAELADA